MARYNEILVGRFARAVQKLFGMKGEVPVGSLAGEVNITHFFQNGAENRYLEGWDRFATNFDVAAVAAQFGEARLRNPNTSNMIAVVEKINFINIAGVTDQQGIILDSTSTDLGATLAYTQLDSRGRPAGSLVTSKGNNVAGPAAYMMITQVQVGGQADLLVVDIQEFAVLPGRTLRIFSGIANQRLSGSIVWRERFLEESERT